MHAHTMPWQQCYIAIGGYGQGGNINSDWRIIHGMGKSVHLPNNGLSSYMVCDPIITVTVY